MEINKLNEKAIQSAKPGTKDYAKSDGAGLCLWVTTAGGKLWRWGYDFQGKEKLMSYGKYPDVGLARAREFHAAARSWRQAPTRWQTGKPRKTRTTLRTRTPFRPLPWRGWHIGAMTKSKRHADTVERRMKSDILLALGARLFDKIEAPEVVKMIKANWSKFGVPDELFSPFAPTKSQRN
jgi:hypothetical protein